MSSLLQIMDAVVVEANEALGEKYGWAGYRASVESPPIWTQAQDPEEANPLLVQVCVCVCVCVCVYFHKLPSSHVLMYLCM